MQLSSILKVVPVAWLFLLVPANRLRSDLLGQTPGVLVSGQDGSLSHLVKEAPVRITRLDEHTFLVDFGRVAFGNVLLSPPAQGAMSDGKLSIRFGEALKDGRIDRTPPGSVRYSQVVVSVPANPVIVAPQPDVRNTTSPAVLTPASWGVVTPFRWVEVEGWPGELRPGDLRRCAAFDSTWRDDAASFRSSDPMLDRIWELSHYSIKATTFAGVFVDGDRERIAYEADAYLNQLGYYAGDADPRMVRATFDRLMLYPTWPSEWAPHMVFIAYADWMQTGDQAWLRAHYEGLKTRLLNDRVGPDGLVTSSPQIMRRGDLVDWPAGERDGYVFTPGNTVVNAFHLRALNLMARLADALGKSDEAAAFRTEEQRGQEAFRRKLFDPVRKLYRDGTGTEHASLHANLFPLAFGLVPAEDRQSVARWLAGRGMAGSVYVAQYLLEALFENGESDAALRLMTGDGDRTWRHMVESGTTITWEAWDQKYKPNQDWNHAWGAAPANLLPRYVLGVQPARPGWAEALIQPHPGGLTDAEGKVPTPLGEVRVSWRREKSFRIKVELPPGMRGTVVLPAFAGASRVLVNGKRVSGKRDDGWWTLDQAIEGKVQVEER